MTEHILIVEDDRNIAKLTAHYLNKQNFETQVVHTGTEAIDAVKRSLPQIILLDIMLPDIDGWAVCKYVRSISNVPIIMLTAKEDVSDRIHGLQLGSDDYLTKPFDPKELVARIQAVLRRSEKSIGQLPAVTNHYEIYQFGNLLVDPISYTVSLDTIKIDIPRREFDLLHFLIRHPNQVFSRDRLIEQIWGWDFEGEDRVIDLYVKRLRDRLFLTQKQPWQITTVRGVGYKFEVKL